MKELTNNRLLAKNTLWNLGGNIGTVIIALLAIPIIFSHLGASRLGILTLVWAIEGHFGIFDLGLSHALTKLISEKLGANKESETPPIFWLSLTLMTAAGIAGALALWLFTPQFVQNILKIPIEIEGDAITCFKLVAISLPIVISSAALRGTLAAHQRFDLLNLVRLPTSLLSYAAPLLAIPFTESLWPIVLLLIVSRLLSWLLHFVLCLRTSPTLFSKISIRKAPIRRMLSFGGWMTVTNIISPIIVNLDRFIIGSIVSVASVAYYAAPYEASTKLWMIPTSITSVLFPALSATIGINKQKAAVLYAKAVKYIFLLLFPITILAIMLGKWVLQIWLGQDFSDQSTPVFKLLIIGVFANSLGQVPFWQIQAVGRPDIPAKIHAIELPIYIFTLWTLTTHFGILGAASAWLVRATLDSLVMHWMSSRLSPETKPVALNLFKGSIIASPALICSTMFTEIIWSAFFAWTICTIFLTITWSKFLVEDEKQSIKKLLQSNRLPSFRRKNKL